MDEDEYLAGDPLVAALRVALAKARAMAEADAVVVGADTVVALDGRCLGKPGDAQEATTMLRGLRKRGHEVLTGVAVRRGDGSEWAAVVSTRVTMRAYSDTEIATYIARGEPFDKAGGYAVQDAEFHPVERLEGCYLNVVGLPLCAVIAGLEAVGVAVPGTPAAMVPPCPLCEAGRARVTI